MDNSSQPQPLGGAPVPAAHADALALAARLSGRARRSTRWYGNYLLVFAAGSFVMSVLTGTFPSPRGVLTTTLVWVAFLTATTVWIAGKKTAIRGMTRLHLVVMLVWGATVVLGTHYFAGRLWWWVLGGLALAAAPVVGAVVAFRRTA